MALSLVRAGALGCALLASTCLTAPVRAQDAPPVFHNVDSNGVDVVLGQFEFSQMLVSIGPNWPRGLRYVRMRGGDTSVDNLSGDIHQSSNEFFVSVGNTSAKFVYSGGGNLFNPGTFSTETADGSTLTRSGGTFTYTNRAGEIARFTAAIAANGQIVPETGRIVDLSYPNGTLVSFNYRTENLCDEFGLNCTTYFRLQSVTNNFNYQLRYTYAQNTLTDAADAAEWRRLVSVKAINSSVDPCDPFADQCSLTQPWPTVSFAVDGSDETVTLPDNNVWRFTGSGNQAGIRRPGSTSDDVTVSYDALFRVQSVTGAAGTWTYSYSDNGTIRTTTVQGPLNGARTVTSDTDRQIITADQDALGRTTSFEYDSNERLTRVSAPELNYVQFTYDARGNITETRVVAKPTSGLPDIVETATYPSNCPNPVTCNLPTSTTDARGNTTDFTWDTNHGGPLTVTAPAPAAGAIRPQTRFGYTSSAVGGYTVRLPSTLSQCQTQANCAGTADEAVTTINYTGPNFLPTSLSSGNGSGSLSVAGSFTYDNIGNIQTMDGPLDGAADTTRVRYNALRQVVGVIGPDPDGAGALKNRAQRFAYNSAGLLANSEIGTVNSQSDADWAAMSVLESIATDRDSLGRPTAERVVAGGTTHALTQIGHDARGRVRCVAERMNPAEFSSLPADACTLDTEGTFGPDRITRTTYDAADQVTKVETGVGTAIGADEVITAYTSNGQVQHVTDANGNRTTYEYDGHDRLWKTFFPSPTTPGVSSTTDFEQLTYETLAGGTRTSNLVVTRRLRDSRSIVYGYDALNRLTLRNIPEGDYADYDITYAYDLFGRPLSATDTPGHVSRWGWDALGRMVSEDTWRGNNALSYDPAGRMTRLTWVDGFYVTYDYDTTGAVIRIREQPEGTGLVLAAYAYDDRGRRTLLTRGNGSVTSYGYDAVSRLASLAHDFNGTSHDVTLTFSYNPAGQIASNDRSNDAFTFTGLANQNVTDTHNGLNQLTARGGNAVTHNPNGNIAEVTGTSGPSGMDRFWYTSENRLATTLNAQGATYLPYWPTGELAEIYRADDSETLFEYVGGQMITERGDDWSISARHVWGPGIDEPIVTYEGSGTSTRRWLHADERGSIVALSDGSGNVSAVNRYDEYGLPQGSVAGRFGYTGQAWIPETGLSYYRARMYNPTLGRFMQPDPIGYAGGMNLYAYVGNDPVNLTDPFGLSEKCVAVGAGPFDCGPLDRGGLGGTGIGGSGGALIAGPTVSESPAACDPSNCAIVTADRLRRRNRRTPGFPLDPVPIALERDDCTVVRDAPSGFDFSRACRNHDRCYRTLGRSQRQCDDSLLRDMLQVCRQHNNDSRCVAEARHYYRGIRIFGTPAYEYEQLRELRRMFLGT